MDWSKTKTIFIIAFLILDLFLFYQLAERKNDRNNFGVIAGYEDALFNEDMISLDIPDEEIDETFITAEKRPFLIEEFNKFDNQTISFLSRESIVSILHEPIPIPEINIELKLKQLVKEHILFGDSYTFWRWDKETNKLLFFQTYKGKTIFYENAMLSIQLDENNDAIGYEQSFLEKINEIKSPKEKEMLTAPKALEILYKKGRIHSIEDVTEIDLGYYNVPISSEDMQIFAPTWVIMVEGIEEPYLINANEGQVLN